MVNGFLALETLPTTKYIEKQVSGWHGMGAVLAGADTGMTDRRCVFLAARCVRVPSETAPL